MRLFEQNDALRCFAERVNSGEWWALVVLDPNSARFMAHVEETYYSGEANEDFELLMVYAPKVGFIGIGLAKKTRMNADQLAALYEGKVTAADLASRDVLADPVDLAALLWLDEQLAASGIEIKAVEPSTPS